jgi:aspartate/methionine/tyrosine aminotransferase
VSSRFAARADEIAPFHVMAILARAQALEAAGRDIIHLEIGEPDFATPEPVIEAGIAALKAGETRYTSARGLPVLREAIAGFYQSQWGVALPAEQIMVTPGASGALLLVLGLLAGPGDEVLMADPGYPCNAHFARFCEARAVRIPVDAGTRYQLTLERIERHASAATRVLLIASPSNPTGTVVEFAELVRIARWCAERGIALVVDEIYLALCDRSAQHSAARLLDGADHVYLVNSFSKYFQMTGWRLGWLVAPPHALDALERLAQNLYLAAPTPAQHAALAAFDPATLAILENRRADLGVRRDYLLNALRDLGFVIPVAPDGAFYLYANCSRHSDDSDYFCQALLEQAGVAITPGRDFGDYQASRYVRFAYTQTLPKLHEAVARIAQFLAVAKMQA